MSVRRSLAWAYSGQFVSFVIQFAGSVVIARLLSPQEIGIYAIAMAAMGVVSIFTVFGVGSFVVREPDLRPHTLEAAFTVNAVLTVALSLALVGLSVGAGKFLGEPRAGSVLRVIAVSNLFGIIGFRPITMLQREMQFKRLSLIAVAQGTVLTCATVGFALAGASYMSAAYASLISSAVGAISTLMMGKQYAGYRLSTIGWMAMLTFGIQMMSVSGVATLAGALSDIILGRLLGVAALGLYSRANSLSNLIFNNLYGTATRVVFVQLSKDFRETGNLRPTFVRGLQIITAFMGPILVGLAILSRPVVFILYGENWLAAALPLSILLIAQCLGLGFGMNWELFVLRGETGRQAKYEISRSILNVVLFTIGCTFNLAAAAAGRIGDCAFGLILYIPHVKRLAKTEPREITFVYRESALLTAVAVLPAAVLMLVQDWSARTPLWQIIAAVALGIAMWAAVIGMLGHPIKNETAILVRSIKRRNAN